jgi:DnaJ-class molecular chaperone
MTKPHECADCQGYGCDLERVPMALCRKCGGTGRKASEKKEG